MSIKTEFEGLFEKLKKERDELILKSRLATMEAKDELAQFDEKWETLKLKAANIADSSKDTTEDFIARAKHECEELNLSYKRFGPYFSEKASLAENELGRLYEKVKTERDEVIIKMHLASMDVKDEFVVADKKLDKLKIQIFDIADDTKETSEDIVDKARVVSEELKDTYCRIKQRLSE